MSKEQDFATVFIPANIKQATKEAGAGSSDLWNIPYENLRIIDGFNVRTKDQSYEDHVTWLTQQLTENGFDKTKPLTGYAAKEGDKTYIALTDGHCRHAAIGRAIAAGVPLTSIPVVLKSGSTSLEDLTLSLVTANGGKPLSPFEIAQVCKRLESYGWAVEKIAAKLSFTQTYITDLLFLMGCSPGIRKLVETGKVSAGTAIIAVRKHGADALDVLKGAVTVAEDKGKKKATAKDLEPTFKSEIKKRAGELYEALAWVQEDGAYRKLSDGTRTIVDDLIASLPEEPQKK